MAVFVPRLKIPEENNPYYNTKANGGYSSAIIGKPTEKGLNVLRNCVGYAYGRFNEIANEPSMKYLRPVNAELFVTIAKQQGLSVGMEPKVGSVMCWQKGGTLKNGDGAGHVAVVEIVHAKDHVTTSESGYNASRAFWTQSRYKCHDGNWGQLPSYRFLGFIYSPVDFSKEVQKMPYVKKGDYGAAVEQLQKSLFLRGYLRKDEIDGDFGKITLGALLAFQFENGLVVDGVAGPATQKKLYGI